MQILRGRIEPGRFRQSVVTIGNFDGVHLGHHAVIRRTLSHAKSRSATSIAVTFEPHPVKYLHPEKGLLLIYPYEECIHLLRDAGLDALIVQEFDMRLKDTPAYDYCRDFLKAVLDIEHLVVGHDFNFGKGRAGSPEQLVDIGKELGFIVERVPAYIVDDEPVSSSRIRKTIIAGDVALARRLLGSPFHLRGEVVVGDRRGKAKLGYPTANLSFQQELIPADGVYLACIEVSGERHPALANVGNNPTFHNNHRPSWVEAWIMDFSRDIYNEKITVHFIERLRGELTFDSEQELIQRIKMDEQQARLRCREEDPCAF